MANLCSHWNDNYENSVATVKNVYSIMKEAVTKTVIKNMPVDQGLEGNIENENRTMGFGSIISIPM